MGLTAAEKMRRYREKIKANVEKYEEVKKKDLQRIKANRKKASELNAAQKDKLRAQWREQKKRQRTNKQKINVTENADENITNKRMKNVEQSDCGQSRSDNDTSVKNTVKYLKKKQ